MLPNDQNSTNTRKKFLLILRILFFLLKKLKKSLKNNKALTFSKLSLDSFRYVSLKENFILKLYQKIV